MFVHSRNKQRWRRADSAAMRAHNEGMILQCMLREEPISRAALARRTGLARSTVTNIVHELLDAGLVFESHVGTSRGGRPPIALSVERDRVQLLGVELGASHVTVLRTNLMGEIQCVEHRPAPVEADPEATLALLLDMVASARTQPVVGMGLAVPSPLDPTQPGLLSPRILPAWEGIAVAERIADATDLTVFMENDANLGALAEGWWGIGLDRGDFAYIKLATGIGCGLLVDGRIYRGATGIAGEIGHSAVRRDGPLCRCGLHGCLEAASGTAALVSHAREHLASTGDARAESLDLDGLLTAVDTGESWAVELIASAGRDLGVAVANLLNLLNPGAVVLGGSLTRAGDHLLAPMRLALQSRSLVTSVEATEVLVSTLGAETIALGAAALVLDHALQTPSVLLESAASNP